MALTMREVNISKLAEKNFDIFIIGGGITGAGCCLDAATRGFDVAMIERYDFSSETSSKSTKLLHGGYRYLIKAISSFSLSQLKIVINGLCERKRIMDMAPYLTYTVRILIPIYTALEIPYYFIVSRLYEWLSFGKSLGQSYVMSKEKTMIYYGNIIDKELQSSVVYCDGMMQDARMNIMVARTASSHGAIVANYVEFLNFNKDQDGNIESANCIDKLTGNSILVKAKVFISAVGCFTDEIRKKNDFGTQSVIRPSIGTHIILDSEFGPEQIGLLDTDPIDKRLVFILPWNGHTLVGSTDYKTTITSSAAATRADIDFLLNEVQKYISKKISIKNVKSAWAGIRPLVSSSSSEEEEQILREFSIFDDENGLVSVVGGKFTLFRLMGEKTIDLVISKYNLKPLNKCVTKVIRLDGCEKYSRDLYFKINRILDTDIEYSKLLLERYGSRAFEIKKYLNDYPEMLSTKYFFTCAEAIYCIENEFACTSCDVVFNRFGIAFYDIKEAYEVKRKLDVILKTYFKSKGKEYTADETYSDVLFKSFSLDIISNNET